LNEWFSSLHNAAAVANSSTLSQKVNGFAAVLVNLHTTRRKILSFKLPPKMHQRQASNKQKYRTNLKAKQRSLSKHVKVSMNLKFLIQFVLCFETE
jgi:hypothetical protein